MRIPQALETERLSIRRYTVDDLQDLYLFFNNEEVTSSTDMPLHRTFEETEEFLEMIVRSYDGEEPLFAMAISRKDTGKVIGSCGFSKLEFSPDTQIYYALEPEYQGNGYATEAVMKMLEYMILVLDIERISIYCSQENTASINLAKRVGMEHHGTFEMNGKDAEYFLLTREMYLHGN
ncbi:GNAT family N-acetyltransferase [Methanolobus profundi]|uniref:Ribosomal-protein-alanine N-acetyltransferase n=1 Tax=Methanolobus profundi TaxID=487685 RepID=A0A1I4PZA6_9EURY|nr:GNAT family N-acetyltransferase [Methanolobus profundi]SFM33158.1 ribosomal-protein-alanine N-acetyltransferase [Methanolobus profundi]